MDNEKRIITILRRLAPRKKRVTSWAEKWIASERSQADAHAAGLVAAIEAELLNECPGTYIAECTMTCACKRFQHCYIYPGDKVYESEVQEEVVENSKCDKLAIEPGRLDDEDQEMEEQTNC